MQKLSVLIIEDHPFSAEAYKKAFEVVGSANKEISFKIDIANDCDSAYKKILESAEKKGIDIFFLDISLPPSKDGKILSGEDLGIIMKKILPKSKIIVATTHFDNFRIQSIVKSINPEGYLVKNDIDTDELILAIKTVINNPPYYSNTVLKSFRKSMSNIHTLDEIDRQLLYELSIGTKMKDMPNILPLSKAGIEKRKRQLKEIFDIQNQDDRELILLARNKGFI